MISFRSPNLPVKSFTRLAHDVNVHFGQGVSKTRPREMQLHKSHPFLSLQMLAFWVQKIHQTENIWELLNRCSLTLHSGKWYGFAFNCRRPAQRWNYQFFESQAAHSITTFLFLSPGLPFQSHVPSSTISHCLFSWWTIMFFDYQAMSRIMLASSLPWGGGPRSRSTTREASLQLAIKKQTFWVARN